MKRVILFLFFCLSFVEAPSFAVCNKIELGPTFVHVDVLESNHTVKKLDMAAVKGEGSYFLWKGLCLKGSGLYAGCSRGQLGSAGLGLGFCIPVCDELVIMPSAGWTYTELHTKINLEMFQLFHLKESFRSHSPYAALEASYCFCQGWRIIGLYQYAWSRTRTHIKHVTHQRSKTQGPNYALQLERDINENWSASIAGAYNITLSKEKHGLRAYGFRLGVAYWF